MSLTEKQALALRDLAVIVAKAKGVIIAPNLYAYHDARIRIEYKNGKPQALDLFKLGDIASRDPKCCL
jgi:predicted Ser/Thr protein kinase